MIIFVKQITGLISELEVEPTDTIDKVAEKIQDKDGILVSDQRYIYSGKNLEPYRTLKSYGIKNDATLHLLLRQHGAHALGRDVPAGTTFPTEREASQRLDEWKALADNGNFDADTHIVDADAYYAAMDSLE